MLLENGLRLGFGEGPAEFRFLVFDFGADVFGKLLDDVVLLCCGQIAAHGFQIAIDKFHVLTP